MLENSGPISVTLMVVILEAFLERIERKNIREALTINVASLTCKRYVDRSHAQFQTENNRNLFTQLLNKQNPAIEYTTGKEGGSKRLVQYRITVV